MRNRKWDFVLLLTIFAILVILAVLHIQQLFDEAKQVGRVSTNAYGEVVERDVEGRIISLEEALVLAEWNRVEESSGDIDITPTDVNLYADAGLSSISGHLDFGQTVHILQFDRDNGTTMVVSVPDHKIGWLPNNFVILVE